MLTYEAIIIIWMFLKNKRNFSKNSTVFLYIIFSHYDCAGFSSASLRCLCPGSIISRNSSQSILPSRFRSASYENTGWEILNRTFLSEANYDDSFYLEKQLKHWIKRVYMIRILLFVLHYDVLQGQDIITKRHFWNLALNSLGLPNSLENIIGHFNVNEWWEKKFATKRSDNSLTKLIFCACGILTFFGNWLISLFWNTFLCRFFFVDFFSKRNYLE